MDAPKPDVTALLEEFSDLFAERELVMPVQPLDERGEPVGPVLRTWREYHAWASKKNPG